MLNSNPAPPPVCIMYGSGVENYILLHRQQSARQFTIDLPHVITESEIGGLIEALREAENRIKIRDARQKVVSHT